MREYNLTFIDNEDLFNHVKETIEKYRFKINLKEFNKNLIDPIKLTFDAKIYVEMKNKHNTMNSSSSQKTFMRMQSKLLEDRANRCYLIEVIAKNSQNIAWKISLDGESTYHENIRRVSIDKFYEIVTGEKEAFKQLVEALPKVIDDVLDKIEQNGIDNSVFKELKEIDENILKSLYLLSFKKYEGFETFNI